MLSKLFHSNAKTAIGLGMAFLFAGIFLYIVRPDGDLYGRVGVILFTCGAMFVGIAYSFWIAYKQGK